jgi:Flp pilus assembly protein TadD
VWRTQAVEYFQRVLNIETNNGEVWGALGHCYLMMDDLQKAYTAYQQALYHLPNPKVTFPFPRDAAHAAHGL